MKVTPKNSVRKFQMGGAAAAPVEDPNAAAPQGAETPEAGGEDPIVMLIQMAAQALEGQDCLMAMQVCQALVEMAQQGAPAEPQGEPVFRKGGVLVRRIKK